ncbi:MAG: energy transducer TonB [Polyangiaceae bacterium]
MALRNKKRSPVLLISVGAHVALALGIAVIPQQKFREVVAIAMAESTKEEKPKPPPPPRAPEPTARATRAPRNVGARARAAAQVAEAEPAVRGAANFQDIGLSLDASAVDGLAIPVAKEAVTRSVALTTTEPRRKRTLMSKPVETTCTETIQKPVPEVVVRPDYTDAAREARVEGRVRIEVLVDELGQVLQTKILSGLGYGLDEAAVMAVKKMRFRPGTHCNKPVTAPFVMAVRFLLGT